MRAILVRSALLVLLLALTACGGGGGDGGDGMGGSGPFDPGAGFIGSVHSIAAATDGSGDVYVGGDFSSYNGTPVNGIVRLNADGTRDTGFDVGTGFNSVVRSIARATDGSGDVYVGGDFSSYNGTPVNRIVRLNADGTRDTGFDVGAGFDDTVRSIAPATDGSDDVYAGGTFTSYNGTPVNRIVRLNAGGTRDTGFDVGTGFNDEVFSIAPATDGSGDIYVGGAFTLYRAFGVNRIVRINVDGARDMGFDVGNGFDDWVFSIEPASDGSGDVYAGGFFTEYRAFGVNGIVRINADGARDMGFDVGTGFNSSVLSIAPATDGSGDVYVGGDFTIYRAFGVNGIVRVNADGARDTGFDVGAGFSGALFGTVRSVAPATDGSGDAYVGGGFTIYNGTAMNRIARLDPDGTLD